MKPKEFNRRYSIEKDNERMKRKRIADRQRMEAKLTLKEQMMI